MTRPGAERAPLETAAGEAAGPEVVLQVRFRSGPLADRTVSFPCDRHGNVDIDALDETRRRDYMAARKLCRFGHAGSQVVCRPAGAAEAPARAPQALAA